MNKRNMNQATLETIDHDGLTMVSGGIGGPDLPSGPTGLPSLPTGVVNKGKQVWDQVLKIWKTVTA